MEPGLAALAFSCWILLCSELLSLTFLGWAAVSGGGTGADMGAKTGAEADCGVKRVAGCGEDGVGDEGTDVVMEGIKDGGGCHLLLLHSTCHLPRLPLCHERGEADDKLNEGEGDDKHGCVGEGQGVDIVEDGAGAMGVEAALGAVLRSAFALAVLEAS